jgi:hypothetical protein
VSIKARSDSSYQQAATSFEIQGSNDGSIFSILKADLNALKAAKTKAEKLARIPSKNPMKITTRLGAICWKFRKME